MRNGNDAKPLFTIFTPTYNRAHTLPRVYDSICAQEFRDFEWVVVDDGSTDGTEALVEGWACEAPFVIRYFKQANGHKKAAFNRGVKEARGELFLCLDSDDCMPANALLIFHDSWFDIPDDIRDQFVGVTGLCVDENAKVIGGLFPSSPFDSDDLSIRFKWRVKGEKWGFHRRDVLKAYPYPEFILGFVLEGLVWNAIAKKYRMRYVNKIVRIYYIENDSIVHSGKNIKKMRNISEGASFTYANFIDNYWRWILHSPIAICKISANQTRFSWHLWRSGARVVYRPNTVMGNVMRFLTWPVGFGAFIFDEIFLPNN